VGKAATAFYQEMITSVLPSLKRLGDALEQGGRAARQMSRIMKQAEDDSAALFRLQQAGAAGDGGAGGEMGMAAETTPASESPRSERRRDPGTRYVTDDGVRVRGGHSTGDDILQTLNAGTAVQLTDTPPYVEDLGEGQTRTWVEVQLEDGTVGWMAEEFLSETLRSTAPLIGDYVSGWAYGDKEYVVQEAFDVNTTYPAGAVIDRGTYLSLNQEQRNNVQEAEGQYVVQAEMTVTTSYSAGQTLDADSYNALPETNRTGTNADGDAYMRYRGMHPGADISSSDSTVRANADGVAYMYQAYQADEDGDGQEEWHYELYDPANADNNQANDDLGGFGNYIVLETTVNGETYYQVFAHMEGFDPGLTQGQHVTAGTTLGTMGESGSADGEHVHWEVRTDAAMPDTTNENGEFVGHDLTAVSFYPQDDASLYGPAEGEEGTQYYVSPTEFDAMLQASESTESESSE
jgi:murein DD-endopeptidase MepM/ murein hydrolase activator NlpD